MSLYLLKEFEVAGDRSRDVWVRGEGVDHYTINARMKEDPLFDKVIICIRSDRFAIAVYESPIPLHAQILCAIILILVKLLLENSRPTACYFQWNSWKLG